MTLLHRSGNAGRQSWRATCLALGLFALVPHAGLARQALAQPAVDATATGVPGVSLAQLDPAFWIGQLPAADRIVLERSAIAAQNTALMRDDDSMHRLEDLPDVLTQAQVREWITGISRRSSSPRFDEHGVAVPVAALDALDVALALDALPADPRVRFGLVVRRAALRAFPTALRTFSRADDHDIDRLQESALFPGTPVAVVHQSADGAWLFVVSPRYAAWIEADAVATGPRADVFAYVGRADAGRIVTGATVRTVHTFEEPRVSELQLDMGVRLPILPTPASARVNGQHPYTGWIVELPVRGEDGSLAFAPALVQRIADTSPAPLALTRRSLITQAFKFLGERYGWGHGYNARDCSGFVSEVYASHGVLLPRNTSDQAVSPALRRTALGPNASAAQRREAVAALDVGDLIYIPGHVMMMIGRIDGHPYVIHDTNGGSFADGKGGVASLHLNGVSVTPLEPLRFDANTAYTDRITNIVHIRPRPAPAPVPSAAASD
jgi:cell wall-associated NlpC family hydrolase